MNIHLLDFTYINPSYFGLFWLAGHVGMKSLAPCCFERGRLPIGCVFRGEHAILQSELMEYLGVELNIQLHWYMCTNK